MKTGTKIIIIIIMFVLGDVMAPNDVRAQANKTDCARLQKLLMRFPHTSCF